MFFNIFQQRWLFAERTGEENCRSILSVVATALKYVLINNSKEVNTSLETMSQ